MKEQPGPFPVSTRINPRQGRLRGKQPKLSARQEAHLVALHAAGGHTISELEELFSITRSTVYRALARDRARATT